MVRQEKSVLKSYRDLRVWQKAMDLVEALYRITGKLPPSELYGLVAQIRRAGVSVPANIAEGYGRSHRGDYIHHLSIANGSLKEVETHLLICIRLGFLAETDVAPILEEADDLGRMLGGLIRKLRTA